MTIDLPWFPDGDNTSPDTVSVIHRFFGDYYQTYDLLLSGQFSSGTDSRIRNTVSFSSQSKVIQTDNQYIAIDKYNPIFYQEPLPWSEKYYLWLESFAELGLHISEPQPIEYDLEWPVKIEKDCKISYLTFDYLFRGCDFYTRVFQSLREGDEWEPIYPVLHNSITGLDESLNSQQQLVLSISSWCLFEPVEFLRDDDENDTRLIKKSVVSSIDEVTLSYSAQDNLARGCNTPLEITNQLTRYEIEGEVTFEKKQDLIDQVNIDVAAFLAANPNELCLFHSATGGIPRFDDEGIDIGEDFTLDLIGGIFLVPDAIGSVLYFVGQTFDGRPPLVCFDLVETSNNRVVGTTQENIYFQPNEHPFWFLCVIPANNNYWSNLIQPTFFRGIAPSIFRFAFDTNPNIDSFILTRSTLNRISNNLELDISTTNDQSQSSTQYVYPDCQDNGEPKTETRTTFFRDNQIENLDYSRRANNNSNDLVKQSNPINLIDSYFLANNGSELEVTMPDSIRMKEIHAALEADFWGNGQTKQFKVFGQDFFSFFIDKASFQAVVQPALQPESQGLEEQPVTTLPQLIRRMLRMLAGFTGIHDFPTLRQPTYVLPERDAETGQITREEDPAPIISLYEYLITLDKEVQTKLGLWPAVSYNYAQDEEGLGEPPKRELLGSMASLGSDLFELSTRASVVTEKDRIATLITQYQTFEIIKGMGLMFSVEEVELFDGNFISVPRFNGGASLSAQNLAIAQAIDRSSCTTVLPGSLLDNIGVAQDSPIRTPSGGASRRV